VTFLFTDLEGSTRLWEEHPEAMRAALARHDEILRDAVEHHDGQVVKTTGDGLHAAFALAHHALAAALDAQQALVAEGWTLPEPLRVRMGLHTGGAELREGDYFGPAVNRAARVSAAAHGGQIVASAATADLVRDDLADAIELVDLGEHRLRDLARSERIVQVTHPDLPSEFPPLQSLDAHPGNLPIQLTSFVGRDDDVARILAMVDEASLVTLIGTGGVGKTRLAIQVAAELVPRFRDGVWFCELAPADDEESMAQLVAATLGCVQRPGLTMVESIVEYLKVRDLLLVLDNCEHLLDDAGALAEATIAAGPGVTVLATSREALDVTGERVVRVRSLDAPDPLATHEQLLESAAVRLFEDRASDAGAAGGWNEAQWSAVGEICRRVDGIPLAIELAAARAASMSPTDIAAHLDERFRLLTGKRRGRVERHQTLRATVEWSYQLLEQDERTLFDRLGIFAGTFDVAAANAVASDEELDGWQITDSISSLVAKSMLIAEDGADDTTRYAMLETLRQFAREQLEERGNADRWRRRHAEHYVEFAKAAGRGFKSLDEHMWTLRLFAELDNLRTAVGWALDRDDAHDRELAVRIVAALAWFIHSIHTTGLDALAAQAAPFAEHCEPELRSPALSIAAYYETNQGRPERARELVDAALRDGVVATSADPFMAHCDTAYIAILTGDYRRALEVISEAREALDTVNDPFATSQLLLQASVYESLAGAIDQGRVDAEASVELARQLKNPLLLARALDTLAWALQRDDPEGALRALEHSLEDGFWTRQSRHGSSLALAGGLRARLGDPESAIPLLREGLILCRDHGARPSVGATLDWSLAPLVKLGHPEPAATFVGALSGGPLAEVSGFPGVPEMRARILERIRAALGDERTDACVARGAAMTYDEIVEYALDHLSPT
jgi:predicted ATPase/class 3 adenylate cyclase